MRNFRNLHEAFIEKANRPMQFGRLPVSASEPDAPVIAVDRWETKGDPACLVKKYSFRRPEDRVRFVDELFTYEEEVNHNAVIIIDGASVCVKLITKTIDQVTELDKEYAKFADSLYYDIVYSP